MWRINFVEIVIKRAKFLSFWKGGGEGAMEGVVYSKRADAPLF